MTDNVIYTLIALVTFVAAVAVLWFCFSPLCDRWFPDHTDEDYEPTFGWGGEVR